jgi:adenine specific DNA methylase Mod
VNNPPFNSDRSFLARNQGKTQLRRSTRIDASRHRLHAPRCIELHRLLKKTGRFYCHCDRHPSHYVKIMLDQIFGEDQF